MTETAAVNDTPHARAEKAAAQSRARADAEFTAEQAAALGCSRKQAWGVRNVIYRALSDVNYFGDRTPAIKLKVERLATGKVLVEVRAECGERSIFDTALIATVGVRGAIKGTRVPLLGQVTDFKGRAY
jgi:hypothetical protein